MKAARTLLDASHHSPSFASSHDHILAASNTTNNSNNNGGSVNGNDPFTPVGKDLKVDGEEVEGRVSEEEEDDEEEEDGEADEEEDEEDEGEDGVNKVPQDGVRPKLDEGYFEIEAIRRKRVRKGQLEYLIKWRDWPETANTWEPPENLQSVPDVVEAFEARSGKHRKRKRKHAVHHTLPKKRQQRSTTSYSLRQFSAKSVPDNHFPSAPNNDVHLVDLPAHPQPVLFADEDEENGNDSLGKAASADANRDGENDYDPKLTELKATASFIATNGAHSNKHAIHMQESCASIGNTQVNGQSKVDCMGLNQSGRCRGAKRRKSGSVKRFKKDSDESQNQDITVEQAWKDISEVGGNNGQKIGDAKTSSNIVKIIKPLSYSASVSSDVADIIVNFLAMRSDGTEVEVDNKYLKANNPLLLINFYEQRLRFNPTF